MLTRSQKKQLMTSMVKDPTTIEASDSSESTKRIHTMEVELSIIVGSSEVTSCGFTAMDQALQNPLILQDILSLLAFPDLLACRYVSQKWNQMSSSVLLRRDCSIVKLKYDPEKMNFFRSRHHHLIEEYRCFIRPDYENEEIVSGFLERKHIPNFPEPMTTENDSLSGLTSLLTRSPNFPSKSFEFCGGDWSTFDEQIENFFHHHGHLLKSLRVETDSEGFHRPANNNHLVITKPFKHLDHLLTTATPNLEDFDVQNNACSFVNNGGYGAEGDIDKKLCLVTLKTLSWYGPTGDLLPKLLKNCPNLEPCLYVHDLKDLKLLHRVNRVNLVSSMCPSDNWFTPDPTPFHLFLDKNPVLYQLDLDTELLYYNLDWSDMELGAVITRLLESVAGSLVSLNVNQFGPPSWAVRLPPFPTLAELCINSFNDGVENTQCFPIGTNLSSTFPCLWVLDVSSFDSFDDDQWAAHFGESPFVGHLDSVLRLKVGSTCSEFWMSKLHQLCPKFKQLVILHAPLQRVERFEWQEELDECLTRFFKNFQHLEELDIMGGDRRDFPWQLDSALTGLSQAVCRTLYNYNLQLNDDDDNLVVTLRRRPSICDLKGLKKLILPSNRNFYPPCISHVTLKYALRFMRKDLSVSPSCVLCS